MKRNELNDILSDLSDEPGYHARGVEEQSGPLMITLKTMTLQWNLPAGCRIQMIPAV